MRTACTTYGNLQVGFKYIGGMIDEVGPDKFVFGTEESHGYLAGTYARDKDAAVAAMLLAELAAQVKAARQDVCTKSSTRCSGNTAITPSRRSR